MFLKELVILQAEVAVDIMVVDLGKKHTALVEADLHIFLAFRDVILSQKIIQRAIQIIHHFLATIQDIHFIIL